MSVIGNASVPALGAAPGPVPAPRPVYLHAPAVGDPVFGVFHDVPVPADTAVLFLPPFGYDDVCAYRGLRMWALSLAAAGVAALRIDPPGSGDSGGGPRDEGRAAAWPQAGSSTRRCAVPVGWR